MLLGRLCKLTKTTISFPPEIYTIKSLVIRDFGFNHMILLNMVKLDHLLLSSFLKHFEKRHSGLISLYILSLFI